MNKIVKLTLLTLLLSIFNVITAKDIHPTNKDDKKYFSTFRKNEQPKDMKFNLIGEKKAEKEKFYYTVYKENSEGQGYYFKVAFNSEEKPIATYISKVDPKLNKYTLENLKYITNNLLKTGPTAELSDSGPGSGAQCVIKCHRTNHCYDQQTNLGVLLCSLDCQTSCA